MLYSIISGCGAYLPQRVMPNSELESIVDTNDAWIRERTGICQRHIAAEGEYTSDLAIAAAKEALKNANADANEIGAVIVCTSTPDLTMPSTATKVQSALGCEHAMAFDLAAACSGFVYGLSVAHGLLQSRQAKKILVIGAETMSRIVDWNDRNTCILFGDGAGAVVLESVESDEPVGILHCRSYAAGAFGDILNTTGGVSVSKDAGVLTMSGKEVFRHAVDKMGRSITYGLDELNLSASDLDLVIPHQANARIIQSITKHLSFPVEKCIMTLDRHANTSAASIPLALHQAMNDGKIKSGNLVAFTALGAGLTWGCCIIKWS